MKIYYYYSKVGKSQQFSSTLVLVFKMILQKIFFLSILFIGTTLSKTITTLDSAYIDSPSIYSNLTSQNITFKITPKCSVNRVLLMIKESFNSVDTLASLTSPPYKTKWDNKSHKQVDQLRLQFQYVLFHQNGDTIISSPTPNNWIKYMGVESTKRRSISRHLDPEEQIYIDGNIDEWERTPANIINSDSYFKTRWTSSDLYIAVIVEDERITPKDQIELSLDLKPDDSPFFGINQRIFIFGPSRRSFVIAIDRTEEGAIQSDSLIIRVGEEMEWRSKIDNDKYFIEARIPFVLLSDLEFPPSIFGFDITIVDDDKNDINISSWSSTKADSRQIKLNWGNMELKQNFFPLKMTLIIGLLTFLALLTFSSLVGFINKRVSSLRIRKMEFSNTTKNALIYIENNFSNSQLNSITIADNIHVSINELESYIIEDMDNDLDSVILGIRIENAKKLLVNSDDRIKIIAQKCGFKSENDFNKSFKLIMKSDAQVWREGRDTEEEEDEENASSSNTQ